MREILFRAKTESERWIEGDLIHYQSGEVAIIEKPFSKYGYEATEICRRTLVLPDTICQYTGLTDKNGNKIWENDILFAKEPYIQTCPFSIRYNQETISYVGLYDGFGKSFELSKELLNYSEVIGNIFDNLELLKGE